MMNNIFIFYFDLKRNQEIKYQLKDFKFFKNNDFLRQFNYLKEMDFKFPKNVIEILQDKYNEDQIKSLYKLSDEEYSNLIKEQSCITLSFKKLFDLIPDNYKKDSHDNYIYYSTDLKNVYCVQQLGQYLSKEESAAVFSCIINDLLKLNEIDLNKENEIYFICHDRHIDERIDLEVFDNKKVKEFIGFIDPNLKRIINYDWLNIIAFKHESRNEIYSEVLLKLSEITGDEIFKTINEISIKKKLYKYKQELISLWLPLAIDIQGLCEVDEKFKNDYFNDLKDNCSADLVTKHVQLINEINKLTKKNIQTDEEKLSLLIMTLNNSNLDKIEEKGYLNPDGIFFLPKKLQQLSEQFDEIIAEFEK